jgi:hypothetical protein
MKKAEVPASAPVLPCPTRKRSRVDCVQPAPRKLWLMTPARPRVLSC